MAVQVRHLSHSHAFFHDPHAFDSRAMDDAAVTGTVLLDDYGGCALAAVQGIGGTTSTVALSDFLRGDLACDYAFEPKKEPRVAAGRFSEDQSVVIMRPPPAQVGDCDLQGRVLGSSAASSSGRLDNGASVSPSHGLLSRLYHQNLEIDALVRLESERIRAGLEEARRRHARELLAAVERAASGRLRAAQAKLEWVLRCNTELEEKARQVGAECQAWMGMARSHEAVVAGLRATLDQMLLQSPCTVTVSVNEGAAEDAASLSCSCKMCGGGGDACVLLLPCQHLCLCGSCEPAVDACLVCSAAKNASLHVLLCWSLQRPAFEHPDEHGTGREAKAFVREATCCSTTARSHKRVSLLSPSTLGSVDQPRGNCKSYNCNL